MATGRIKFFKHDRGFGFIAGEDGRDYFVHISNVRGRPEEGIAVSFSTRPSQKKPGSFEAYDVVVGDGPSTANSGRRAAADSGPPAPAPTPGRNPRPNHSLTSVSPYKFVSRPGFERQAPACRHEKLNENCYDIAFEVEWEALTPVAANPCSDPSDGTCCPANDEDHYQGYDRRWLVVDGRLAISPFTVKSAVANAFAALLGGCYRVETKVVPHQPDPDKFQCTGAWRRYRVAMNNSKPGLLKKIDFATGKVEIQPVEEYYFDQSTPPSGVVFSPKGTYYVAFKNDRNRKIITCLQDSSFPGATEVVYYGDYRFGMDLSFGPGDFNKHHHHRFYREKGRPLTGRVPLNLKSLDEQKKKVYMGVFRKFDQTAHLDHRTGCEGEPWYQDLSGLKTDDWVYYQSFNNEITAIGLNFQFKTAFHLVEDTIPEDRRACKNMNLLCPRCALFGMVDETGESRPAGGFRGCFKAAALVGPRLAKQEKVEASIPTGDGRTAAVELLRLRDEQNEEIAGQFLLPIQGQAKANKRDQAAYYRNGRIAGVKEYLHAGLTYDAFKTEIERVNRCRNLCDYYSALIDLPPGNQRRLLEGLDYSHKFRNYAVVCREGLSFTGTLGAENCSVEEVAALVTALDHELAGHGFKLGLGKALGLGSVLPRIKKVWLRPAAAGEDCYRWRKIEPSSGAGGLAGLPSGGGKRKSVSLAELQARAREQTSWRKLLEDEISGLGDAFSAIETARQLLNRVEGRENRRLVYPPPGNYYWRNFGQQQAD